MRQRSCSLGSSTWRSPSWNRFRPNTSRMMASAGEQRDMRRDQHRVAAVRQHRAPFGQRRLRAEAEEAEARGGQDRDRDAQGHHDEQRRADVGEDVARKDAQVGQAGGARRLDIGLVLHHQRRAARQPREDRNGVDRDRDDRVGQAGAEHADDHDREQHARKGEQHVDQPHDHGVDAAADIARHDADRHADRHRERDREHAFDQRDARAVDDAREQVAAELVGAEPVLGRRRHQHVHQVVLVGIVGRDQRREDAAEHEHQHDREPRQREPRAAQLPQREARRAVAGDARARSSHR